VFGTAPGSGPTDETIPELPGYRPTRFEHSDGASSQHDSARRRYTIVTNKRIVQHRDDGNWEVRKPGAPRARKIVRTQSEGIERARTILGDVSTSSNYPIGRSRYT